MNLGIWDLLVSSDSNKSTAWSISSRSARSSAICLRLSVSWPSRSLMLRSLSLSWRSSVLRSLASIPASPADMPPWVVDCLPLLAPHPWQSLVAAGAACLAVFCSRSVPSLHGTKGEQYAVQEGHVVTVLLANVRSGTAILSRILWRAEAVLFPQLLHLATIVSNDLRYLLATSCAHTHHQTTDALLDCGIGGIAASY